MADAGEGGADERRAVTETVSNEPLRRRGWVGNFVWLAGSDAQRRRWIARIFVEGRLVWGCGCGVREDGLVSDQETSGWSADQQQQQQQQQSGLIKMLSRDGNLWYEDASDHGSAQACTGMCVCGWRRTGRGPAQPCAYCYSYHPHPPPHHHHTGVTGQGSQPLCQCHPKN
jgi:hypothetical protein